MNHVWSLNSIFWIPQYSSISKFRTTSKSKTKVAETFLTLPRPVEQVCSTFSPPLPECESLREIGVQNATRFGSLYSPKLRRFPRTDWDKSAGQVEVFPVSGTQRGVCWDESNFVGTRKTHSGSSTRICQFAEEASFLLWWSTHFLETEHVTKVFWPSLGSCSLCRGVKRCFLNWRYAGTTKLNDMKLRSRKPQMSWTQHSVSSDRDRVMSIRSALEIWGVSETFPQPLFYS